MLLFTIISVLEVHFLGLVLDFDVYLLLIHDKKVPNYERTVPFKEFTFHQKRVPNISTFLYNFVHE